MKFIASQWITYTLLISGLFLTACDSEFQPVASTSSDNVGANQADNGNIGENNIDDGATDPGNGDSNGGGANGGTDPETDTGDDTDNNHVSCISTDANDSNGASISASEQGSYVLLKGSIHEHSGFSDGAIGTSPVDYFQAGREAGLDFMASSEHSDNDSLPLTLDEDCVSEQFFDCLLLPTPDSPTGGVQKYQLTGDIAAAASDESFTAIRGFEWTSDRFGHINVFFSQNNLNAKTSDGAAASMESFWLWLGLDPALGGGADGLVVFNHPGREDAIQSNIPDPAYTYNDFAYRPEVADRVVGIEVFGKSSDAYDIENGAPTEGWYPYALDRQWKLGPVGAEDEHGTQWGQANRAKTFIIAKENSLSSIREALLARRMFAVAQNMNNIRLDFTADGNPMGSEYAPPAGSSVLLSGEISAGFPEAATLQILSNGGEIIAQTNTAELQFNVVVDQTERWYFLKLLDADNKPIAYSKPGVVTSGQRQPGLPARKLTNR